MWSILPPTTSPLATHRKGKGEPYKEKFSEGELKERLTDTEFQVTQKKGTERAYTGKYYNFHEDGTYRCVVCGHILFKSDTKYESNCGWPAFFDTAAPGIVRRIQDFTHGMSRIEVTCANCGAHLGHVFDDGPKPTGLRYCINSASLKFDPKKSGTAEESKASTNTHSEL